MKIRTIATALCGLVFISGAAHCAEIRVLSSGAMQEIVTELLPAFEKTSGHKLAITWSGTADIKRKIAAGETYDLVIVAAPEIDTFIKDGRLMAGTRFDLLLSGVGVAVRKGAPKPDIGSADALRKALLDARSVAFSTGPSGWPLPSSDGSSACASTVLAE